MEFDGGQAGQHNWGGLGGPEYGPAGRSLDTPGLEPYGYELWGLYNYLHNRFKNYNTCITIKSYVNYIDNIFNLAVDEE